MISLCQWALGTYISWKIGATVSVQICLYTLVHICFNPMLVCVHTQGAPVSHFVHTCHICVCLDTGPNPRKCLCSPGEIMGHFALEYKHQDFAHLSLANPRTLDPWYFQQILLAAPFCTVLHIPSYVQLSQELVIQTQTCHATRTKLASQDQSNA